MELLHAFFKITKGAPRLHLLQHMDQIQDLNNIPIGVAMASSLDFGDHAFARKCIDCNYICPL